MTEKRWLASYVKMHHEKRVRDRLTAMGIENFLPVQEEVRQWSDRKKKVERVLIPMMIFVRVNTEEQRAVITHPSILRYLTLRGEHTPTEIPAEQMERFRFMLDHSDSAVSFSTDDLQPGEKVRVIKGPLAGLEGELITVEGKSKIAIRIHQLGCAEVEMSVSMVEKI
ncbi:N-Utilization Substance G (NusG) N-terminal domain [Proteiniphilum saccharofermentans]|uniref:N-Utilization Substance G (NusG) N-terminal domain n=1 Tax=Proteiniphilum saccharofermentans TaxID=1642647 RepID=A0A1R3SZ96_9BACT|nr:UpxY family transcription antiterminator [Proteiniphilum saccharofermentans]SCD20230.1 N-Utilization Substance G (NusG) N-terminal domain [Proteiniphilum saccharofermentans]